MSGKDIKDRRHEVQRTRVALQSSCRSVSGLDPSEPSLQLVRAVGYSRSSLMGRQLSPTAHIVYVVSEQTHSSLYATMTQPQSVQDSGHCHECLATDCSSYTRRFWTT